MMDINLGFSLWFTKFLDKKSAGSGANTHTNNEKLAEELHEPIIKTFKKEVFIIHLKTIFGVLI